MREIKTFFSIFRRGNFYVMVLLDLAVFTLALLGAYLFRFDFSIPAQYLKQFFAMLPLVLPVKAGAFFLFGLYKGMWRYTSLADFWKIMRASLAQSAALVLIILFNFGFTGFSRGVFIIDWMLTILLATGLRVGIRTVYALKRSGRMSLAGLFSRAGQSRPKSLILVGAGQAGEKLAREIIENASIGLAPVGFVDDDPAKLGRTIHNLPVLGAVSELEVITGRIHVDEILISIATASGADMRRIVGACEATGLPYKTLPAISELIGGKVSISSVREVNYLDLLGRTPVELDTRGIGQVLGGKRVLVTGCGGSIGSELVRQILPFAPERIILVDAGEYNLFKIQTELAQDHGFSDMVPVLGRVQDAALMDAVFKEHKPHCVFHAAAYKHVPMMEANPWQAVDNNVVGTRTVMNAAHEHGTGRFVIVSTDKAVRPTNVMGASKRVTELFMHQFADSPTRFTAVRFGNVLGSSGSVGPLFMEQIARGGPVTVTHPEVTRYFMSIAEAAQLILQAGAMARGGELFVLEMGSAVKIAAMAEDLIRLAGKEPGRDVEIVYTGLRPGEKLYEELITADEGIVRTEHEKIMVLGSENGADPDFAAKVRELEQASVRFDGAGIKRLLRRLVPEYTPDADCGDVLVDCRGRGAGNE